jgi:hypothetical protein
MPYLKRFLNARRFEHITVEGILNRIRDEGAKYVVSLEKSLKTAQSGYSFAKRARGLCTTLAERKGGFDEVVVQSIAKIRDIAQEAHAIAKTTATMFRANMQEFTEVRGGILKNVRSNPMPADPSQHPGDFEEYQGRTSGERRK